MYYDNMNTMKNDTEIKIQEILDEMQQMFKTAIGPRNRREYMNSIGVSGRDWQVSLTPEQIISNKIPAQVIGCTGIAKLFCKLATDRELTVFVVCTAKFDDWMAAKQDNNKTINKGHQLNAVEIDGILRVFDAGRRRVHFIDTNFGLFDRCITKRNHRLFVDGGCARKAIFAYGYIPKSVLTAYAHDVHAPLPLPCHTYNRHV